MMTQFALYIGRYDFYVTVVDAIDATHCSSLINSSPINAGSPLWPNPVANQLSFSRSTSTIFAASTVLASSTIYTASSLRNVQIIRELSAIDA